MQKSDIKRITILTHPFEFLRMWYELKMLTLRLSGDFWGIILFPNGRVLVRNENVEDFLINYVRKE